MEQRTVFSEHLPKSYRGQFPFSIECPSWVYPADILPNVRELADYVDSIELILFESGQEFDLPGQQVFDELAVIAERSGLNYTVHLPLDRYLGSEDTNEYKNSIEAVTRFILASESIHPLLYYLHLDSRGSESGIDQWKGRCRDAIGLILKNTETDPVQICIEMLEYPFEQVEDVVEEFNLSVCMDAGHLMEYGYDIDSYYEKYRDNIKCIHLHALNEGKAHGPLTGMNDEHKESVRKMLADFKGTVTLEMFSFEYLKKSLEVLEELADPAK